MSNEFIAKVSEVSGVIINDERDKLQVDVCLKSGHTLHKDVENMQEAEKLVAHIKSQMSECNTIRNLKGSEIDRLDNLGVAVQALVEAEIEECNKESVVHRKENLEALRAVIKVLRRTFHDG